MIQKLISAAVFSLLISPAAFALKNRCQEAGAKAVLESLQKEDPAAKIESSALLDKDLLGDGKERLRRYTVSLQTTSGIQEHEVDVELVWVSKFRYTRCVVKSID